MLWKADTLVLIISPLGVRTISTIRLPCLVCWFGNVCVIVSVIFVAYKSVRLSLSFFPSKVVGCGLYRSELCSPEFLAQRQLKRAGRNNNNNNNNECNYGCGLCSL